VGPKRHKVRMCKAPKQQSRNGLHAWQEMTIDDLVGPNYVWYVRDLNAPALDNNLKRYYGKAPAVVELCVQVGAPNGGATCWPRGATAPQEVLEKKKKKLYEPLEIVYVSGSPKKLKKIYKNK
jgi:hypothetical protein